MGVPKAAIRANLAGAEAAAKEAAARQNSGLQFLARKHLALCSLTGVVPWGEGPSMGGLIRCTHSGVSASAAAGPEERGHRSAEP